MIIQFVHDTYEKNMGDIQSCPLNHFEFNADTVEINLMNETSKVSKYDPVIIGGGGLLQDGELRYNLCKIIKSHKSKVIIWGVGLNSNYKEDKDIVPDIFKKADVVGIRDFGFEFNCVPCVSCMHDSFKKEYEIKNDIVCFEGNKLDLPFPTMPCVSENSMDMIIEFLGTARTIITSSYHGMYWGTLLKREVIVIPNEKSSKFYHFPRVLPITDLTNWESFVGKGNIYPDFYDECVNKNILFKENVEKILGIEISEK